MKTVTASDRMNMGLERTEMRLRLAGREPWGCFSTRPLDLPTQSAEPPCTWPVRTVVWEGGAVRLLPIPIRPH